MSNKRTAEYTCSNCGRRATRSKGDYLFKESGLPVKLVGVHLISCRHCGNVDPEIPAPRVLMRHLAQAVLAKPTLLTPAEVRFLRTRAGRSQLEFARLLHVSPTTVSRWETGTAPIPPSSDVSIRSLIRLLDEGLRDNPETLAAQIESIDETRAEPVDRLTA